VYIIKYQDYISYLMLIYIYIYNFTVFYYFENNLGNTNGEDL
jgi:hypothetical protein